MNSFEIKSFISITFALLCKSKLVLRAKLIGLAQHQLEHLDFKSTVRVSFPNEEFLCANNYYQDPKNIAFKCILNASNF